MEEEGRIKSRLYVLQPLVRKLPEVELPKRHVSFKEKFVWTGLALVVFLLMTQIPLYGITPQTESFFGELRFVLASHSGSLMELGIGPIVTASIILQLLVGSKIIGLDLKRREDRALFTGVQKFAAIVMAVFEASMFAFGGWYDPRRLDPNAAALSFNSQLFIVFQLVLGSVVVIYLDELVSKYGFGSGISLFIAAGVSATIFWQAFSPFGSREYAQTIGAVPNFIGTIISGRGIEDAFFRGGLPNMMGVIATIVVFLLVVYAENMRIEIPLAYGKFGGLRGRYPIKFLYASVIPVILAMAVFANIRIFAIFFPALGGVNHFLTAPHGIYEVVADPIRALVYLGILTGLCTFFAWLWIQMTGMGPREIAEQIDHSGMLIPGFRRDVRVMEQVLSRYIISVTLLGGAFIGILSAIGDFMGALSSGTGILLTVGIMYSLYQEIAKERVAEMFPAMRRFFGE